MTESQQNEAAEARILPTSSEDEMLPTPKKSKNKKKTKKKKPKKKETNDGLDEDDFEFLKAWVDEDDESLEEWLSGESPTEINSKKENESTEKKNTEPLKEWLEGEKSSLEEWLGEKSTEEKRKEVAKELKKRGERLRKKIKKVEEKEKNLRAMEKTLIKYYDPDTEKIDIERLKGEDLPEFLDNIPKLKRFQKTKTDKKLEKLKNEKQQLENSLERLKQGCVSIFQYLYHEEGITIAQKEKDKKKKRLESLKQKNTELKEKIKELKNQKPNQNNIQEKQDQINELKQEIAHKEEKIENLRKQISQKEEEITERQKDLEKREKIYKKQKKKLEEEREKLEGETEQERKRRLEKLQQQIKAKEEELKTKQNYIKEKEQELEVKEKGIVEESLQERKKERQKEIDNNKCKTGTNRLDDLLLGGIPLGSNVSIHGPPHVGKETMVESFIGNGLEKGVPGIWILTDKTIDDIKDEMQFILPTYNEYEKRNLVYYVDAYTPSLDLREDELQKSNNIIYVEEPTDIGGIIDAVNTFASEITKNYQYYRVAFISVSTIITHTGATNTFRHLQPFSGKRANENAVSLYTLETQMHNTQDTSMLSHMMDGKIEFKIDQGDNYLRAEGLGDLQTRDWITYTHTRAGIQLGSFSLETIQ